MIDDSSKNYLDSFINFENDLDRVAQCDFKPERMRALLKKIGDPHDGLKTVHVAGSKGKGSISAILAHILKAAGYKTGLYTSPHLNDPRERIRILDMVPPERESPSGADLFDDMISESVLASIINEIKPAIESIRRDDTNGPLTFFEVFTAAALYYFRKHETDVVILETGLGGRLDATNAASSVLAVIAPISLEHTRILGNDILQIAREKAAIIKDKRQNVVIAQQIERVKDVFKNRCRRYGITPLWVEDQAVIEMIDQSAFGQEFQMTTPRARYANVFLRLPGRHQRENCATAVSAAESLAGFGFKISVDQVRDGIRSVIWPGRFEVAKEKPMIILDGAHNMASIKALIDLVKDLFEDKNVIVVMGVSRDKNITSIAEALSEISEHILFVKADHPRAKKLPGALSIKKALDLVMTKCEENDIILVTGSLFVVAEARKYLMSVNRYINRISRIKV